MRLILIVILVTTFTCLAAPESSLSLESSAAQSATGLPSFTNINMYNSHDFCGSPLGLLDADSVQIKLDLRARTTSFTLDGAEDSLKTHVSSFATPNLLISKPGIAYVQLCYWPTSIEVRDVGKAIILDSLNIPQIPNTLKSSTIGHYTMMLHRFGLTIAAGSKTGTFRMGINAEGYYGKQDETDSLDKRVVMGFRNLGLYLGSRIHELVTIGFNGNASGYLDTLADLSNVQTPDQDRYFYGQIPRIGSDIVFGKPGFPVRSNFNLEFSKTRFIYVTKLHNFGGVWDLVNDNTAARWPNTLNKDGNENPIVGDSMGWQWQTLGDFTTHDFQFNPAILFGYWRNQQTEWQPTEKNDNPLSYTRERTDSSWTYSSFTFGFGSAVGYKNVGTFHAEFSFSNLKLAYGDAWKTMADRKDSYARVSLGAEVTNHALPQLKIPKSMELVVRLGYLYRSVNNRFDAYRQEENSAINRRMTPLSQYYRYIEFDPERGWGAKEKIHRLSFGVGSSFFSKLLDANISFAFPFKNIAHTDFNGFEFGADLIYNKI